MHESVRVRAIGKHREVRDFFGAIDFAFVAFHHGFFGYALLIFIWLELHDRNFGFSEQVHELGFHVVNHPVTLEEKFFVRVVAVFAFAIDVPRVGNDDFAFFRQIAHIRAVNGKSVGQNRFDVAVHLQVFLLEHVLGFLRGNEGRRVIGIVKFGVDRARMHELEFVIHECAIGEEFPLLLFSLHGNVFESVNAIVRNLRLRNVWCEHGFGISRN